MPSAISAPRPAALGKIGMSAPAAGRKNTVSAVPSSTACTALRWVPTGCSGAPANSSTVGCGAPPAPIVRPTETPAAKGSRPTPPNHAVGSSEHDTEAPPAAEVACRLTPGTSGHTPRSVPTNPTNGLIASNRSITRSACRVTPSPRTWPRSHPPGSRNKPTGAMIGWWPLASAAPSRPRASATASIAVATVASMPLTPSSTSRVASAGSAVRSNPTNPSASGAGHNVTAAGAASLDWVSTLAANGVGLPGCTSSSTAMALTDAEPTVRVTCGRAPPMPATVACHGSAPTVDAALNVARLATRSSTAVAGPDVMVTTSPVRAAPGTRAARAVASAVRAVGEVSWPAAKSAGSCSRWVSASGTRPRSLDRPMPSSAASRPAAIDNGSAARIRWITAFNAARASGRNGRSSIVPDARPGLTTIRSRHAPSAATSCNTSCTLWPVPPRPTSTVASTKRTSNGAEPGGGVVPGPPINHPSASARISCTRRLGAATSVPKGVAARPSSTWPDTCTPCPDGSARVGMGSRRARCALVGAALVSGSRF